MKEVGRLDFLETILQAFTIDSEGQRVAISSAEISWRTPRTTTEKVGFLGADAGPGFPIYGGDGDRWAVRGDLKGLYEVGSERGFGDDQRGFVIPGHFFNSEHSPYLFPLFNLKKHRSNALWVAMQPTIPNTRDFEIMLKIVPIDGIGLSCVALEMSRTFLML
jgi:hypothetical protein